MIIHNCFKISYSMEQLLRTCIEKPGEVTKQNEQHIFFGHNTKLVVRVPRRTVKATHTYAKATTNWDNYSQVYVTHVGDILLHKTAL